MLWDLPWLYRSCCCWTCMEILSYCQNKHRQQSGVLFPPCRWPLTQTTNSLQYKSFMHVSGLFGTSVLHKAWMYEGKKTWLKMRDWNQTQRDIFPSPFKFHIHSWSRTWGSVHAAIPRIWQEISRIWAESDSSAGQRWLALLNKTKTLNRPIHENQHNNPCTYTWHFYMHVYVIVTSFLETFGRLLQIIYY